MADKRIPALRHDESLEEQYRKLVASETRYRRLFEAAQDGILILDADTGVIVDVNPYLTELLGFAPWQFLGKHLWDLGFFKDIVANHDSFLELQRHGYVHYEDKPLEAADGRRIDVEFVSNIYDVDGTKVIQCNIRDIADRKRAQEKAQREQAFLDRLIETVPEGIAISDVQGRVLQANAEFARMFGYPADEAVGQRIDDLIVPAGYEAEARATTDSASQGRGSSLETIRRRKDGAVIEVSLIVAPIIVAGKVEAGYGIYRDISQRKQAEERLRQSELRYRTFLDVTTDMAFLKDESLRYIVSNKANSTFLGTTEEAVIGHTDFDLMPTEAALACRASDQEALASGVTIISEETVASKIYQTTKFAVPLSEGHVGVGGYVRDITEQKKAEVELRQSEEKFRSVFELSPLGKSMTDPGGTVHVNKAFADMLGYSMQELENANWRQLTYPDDIQASADLVESLVSGKAQRLSLQKRYLHKNGSIVWAHITSAYVRIGDDKPGFLLTSVEDITENRKAEENLRENEAKYRALFENMASGSCLDQVVYENGKAVDYRILDINPAFEKIIGVTRENAIGKLASALYGDEIPFFSTYVRVAETGEPVSFEAYFPPIKRYLAITASCPGKGRFSTVFSDITDRKRTEGQLRETSNYLNNLLDYANAPIVVWDPTYHVTLFNHAFERLTGRSASEVVGMEADLLFPAAEREASLEILRRANSGERLEVVEIDVQHVDGSVRTLLWNSASLVAPDGKTIIATIAQGQDITERKRATREMETLQAKLRQSEKMDAIGELAGGVAHDFNNLLTGILGNVAIMSSDLPSSDPLVANLSAIEAAARQAADLTKGLLTFSRSATVLPVPMNTTAALDATLALLKQSLPATMKIVRDDDQAAWTILLDQSQMTQILLNLAVNARDAMMGKGTLTIRTRNEVVEEDYVQNHPFARTGEFVHLSVTDTGSGMSSEVMQHLFEPFYTTKPVGFGTGLGLSVVYGAVKQAGGWITAVSTEGVGTTFDIYLPRCLEEPTQSFTPSPLPVNVGSGTVLVVEDEPVVRAVAQALLTRSGYTVLTAPDGASALNVLHEHLADIGLILLDMTMPGMTSGEIVQAVRAVDPTVPILLNSGYTSNGAVNQMLAEHSVQGFLGKPYDLHQLLENVQRLLRRG